MVAGVGIASFSQGPDAGHSREKSGMFQADSRKRAGREVRNASTGFQGWGRAVSFAHRPLSAQTQRT